MGGREWTPEEDIMTASPPLLVKNGRLFDAERRTFRAGDVLLTQGRIAAVGEALPLPPGGEILDAGGRLVCPGLVDMHLHCFRWGQVLSIDADQLAPESGTTTFVDAGSCGSLNFLAFREYVIRPATARILVFLNISTIGLQADGIGGNPVGENDDERLLHVASALETIEKNRDVIVGIKVRMYTGLRSVAALARAREVADRVGLPIMVHIASGMPPLSEVLALLTTGDIVTHTYHGGADTLLDAGGRIRSEFAEARLRGIEFDVGLDRVHTDLTVARAAIEQGFVPQYLGTDLTVSNRHVTVDVPTTLSKFVALGLPLEEALAKATLAPAAKLGRAGEFGCLREGLAGDLGIFEIQEGEHRFADTYGNTITGRLRLVPWRTVKSGVVLQPVTRPTERYDFVLK
jgi:dihydroorotase